MNKRVLASSDETSEIRHKGVEMIETALSSGQIPRKAGDANKLATSIEENIFKEHENTNEKYRAALRSHVFNLRKNNSLRKCVLTGLINPERFAHMTAFDMAPERLKRMRDELERETILEHQMMENNGNSTDMFRCAKCGTNKCEYTEVQKPEKHTGGITVHVHCKDCGHTWKYT